MRKHALRTIPQANIPLAIRLLVVIFLFSAVMWTNTGAARVQSKPQPGEPPQISQGAQAQIDVEQSGGLVTLSPIRVGQSARISSGGAGPVYPNLGISIEGLNFDQNTANTGFFQIPPDPAGTAGPNHLVSVDNSSIQWFTKTGTLQNNQSLRSFFGALSPQTVTFDPKVIYDHYENRFVVVTLERVGTTNNQASNRSRIYVAVSDDGDPNGTWFMFEIDSKIVIGTTDRWADFPGLAIDEEVIYITNNMFSFAAAPGFGGVRLWIIPKIPFYSGGVATFNIYDPIAAANANPVGDGALATTAQPSMMFGIAPPGVGTFLMQYGGLNDGVNTFLGMIRVDNPLTVPTFEGHFIPVGTIATTDNLLSFPSAPQMGSARRIATNDRRVSQSPIWRNNMLYLSAPTTAPAAIASDAGQVTARWWKVNTTVLTAPTVADQGIAGGEDIAAGTYTFFPTVAVNSNGDMMMGFAASGPNIFPGAYFAGRLACDPPGTLRATGTLRAGVDFYVRAFSTSTTVTSRWGDYTGIALDPADNLTFWLYNEYAMARGTIIPSIPNEDGRWGTTFGSTVFGSCMLNCPGNITVVGPQTCPPASAVMATYATPTFSGTCVPGVTPVCNPPSGAMFPVGTTTVTCTATDACGNSVSCSFSVTAYNACLQDDARPGNRVVFNTNTGDYAFCCGGTVRVTGKGTVVQQGCTVTLQHNAPGRTLFAKIDFAARRGNASLQNTGSPSCTIADSNTRDNNNCTSCATPPITQ